MLRYHHPSLVAIFVQDLFPNLKYLQIHPNKMCFFQCQNVANDVPLLGHKSWILLRIVTCVSLIRNRSEWEKAWKPPDLQPWQHCPLGQFLSWKKEKVNHNWTLHNCLEGQSNPLPDKVLHQGDRKLSYGLWRCFLQQLHFAPSDVLLLSSATTF